MSKKTLVMGASTKPNRYSNYALERLIDSGYDVVAFGKREGQVSGISIETELVPYDDVHTITLYLGPKNQTAYYDYIVSLNPKRVIFNPGTENPELYQILREANIPFEASCTLVLLSTNQY